MNITDALDAELADIVNRHPECSPLEVVDSLLTVAVVVSKRVHIPPAMLRGVLEQLLKVSP